MEGPFCAHNSYPLCSSSWWKTSRSSRWKVCSFLTGHVHHYMAYNKYLNRYCQTPPFSHTIRKFTNNVSEMKKLVAWDFEDLLQVMYYHHISVNMVNVLIVGLISVFHPSVWGSPWWASQCTPHETIISDGRMVWLCQIKNALWDHDWTFRHAHNGVRSTHEAIPWIDLFQIRNQGAFLWGCSLSAATPTHLGQGLQSRAFISIVISKSEDIKPPNTEVSLSWRLCAYNTNVWMHWQFLHSTGMILNFC